MRVTTVQRRKRRTCSLNLSEARPDMWAGPGGRQQRRRYSNTAQPPIDRDNRRYVPLQVDGARRLRSAIWSFWCREAGRHDCNAHSSRSADGWRSRSYLDRQTIGSTGLQAPHGNGDMPVSSAAKVRASRHFKMSSWREQAVLDSGWERSSSCREDHVVICPGRSRPDLYQLPA